jgi:hypothetical protein
MKLRVATTLFACLLCFYVIGRAEAVIIVSGNEIWDGIQNPHAAQGVTLAGNVYSIPEELLIGSGAKIQLDDALVAGPTGSITFQFTGSGGLKFADNTSIIDVYTGGRFVAPATFTLNLGNNPISSMVAGAGRIVNGASVLNGNSGDSMGVVITSNSNIALGEIDITRVDSRSVGINVIAGGNVEIGRLANPDTNSGGDAVLDVNVAASSMTLGTIDTRAFRPDGIRRNGDINLKALAPPSFDSANAAGNLAAQHIITLNGLVNTNGPPINNADGDINLTAVKVVLGSGFATNLSENADFNVLAGLTGGSYTEASLFMNSSSVTPDSLQFSVLHDGVPEPNSAVLVCFASAALAATRRRRG